MPRSIDREKLDKSLEGKITLVVMATDKGSPALTGITEVIVKVKDVNDNCPYFSEEEKKVLYLFDELTRPSDFHISVVSL